MLWSATGVGVDELEIISDLWRTGDYCQVVAGPFARIDGGAVKHHQNPIAGPNR